MSLRLAINSSQLERHHLAGLQEAFAGWGGEAEFRWWFKRPVGGPLPDLLALTDDRGDPVAGVGISYRRLTGPLIADGLAGILTGAWTAPAWRGRGLFSDLIAYARGLAAARGAEVLMAFSRQDRPSRRPLLKAARGRIESWYLTRPVPPPDTSPDSARDGNGFLPEHSALHRWFSRNDGAMRIAYPSAAVFAQHVRLGDAATTLQPAGPGAWAIRGSGSVVTLVTERPETSRVCARRLAGLAGALAAYTTEPDLAGQSVALGLHAVPGDVFFIGVPGAADRAWEAQPWSLHAIDRA